MGKQMGRRHVETAVNGKGPYEGRGFDKIESEAGGEVTWDDVVEHFEGEFVEKEDGSFKINNLDFQTYDGNVDVKFTRVEEINDRLEIEYVVTPEINENDSQPVTETFYLGRKGGDGTGGGPEDWFDDEDGTIEDDMFGEDSIVIDDNNNENLNSQWDQVNDQEKYSNTIFKGKGVTLPGTGEYHLIGPIAFNVDDDIKFPGSSSSVQVKYSLYISDSIFDLKQDSTFLVESGNAHFNDVSFEFQHNRSAKMCIDGDIFDYGGNTTKERSNEDPVEAEFYPTNSCDFANLDPRKIYYTGELKTGDLTEPDFMTGLILEGTRGE
ncbi:hypothetical protein [Salisediminibacterium beveridgei]|nr:hypothetical protein [Salisediminibacterium beveridgei]